MTSVLHRLILLCGLSPRRLGFGFWYATLVAVGGLVMVIGYFGLVSAAPLPDHRWIVGWNDLLLHCGAFFVLTLAGAVLFAPVWRVGVVVFIVSLLLELMQIFSPHHQMALRDMIANGAGVALALVTWAVVAILWQAFAGKVFHAKMSRRDHA